MNIYKGKNRELYNIYMEISATLFKAVSITMFFVFLICMIWGR